MKQLNLYCTNMEVPLYLQQCHDLSFFVCIVPGIPTHLDIQSQSVTLQWQPLSTGGRCNPPMLYSVRVEGRQLPLCNGQQQIESNITNTHKIITGLCPYSSYRISVKARTNTDAANVCGTYSRSLFVRTLEDGKCVIYHSKLLMLYSLNKLYCYSSCKYQQS